MMAADMWWHIWTRIGGEYVVVVYDSDDGVSSGAGIWQQR